MKVGGIGFVGRARIAGSQQRPASAADLLSQHGRRGERRGPVVHDRRSAAAPASRRSASRCPRPAGSRPGLTAAGGDWDVAIIDTADGRVVAGSACSGAERDGLRPRGQGQRPGRAGLPPLRQHVHRAAERRRDGRRHQHARRRSSSCASRRRRSSAGTSSTGSGLDSPSTAAPATSRSSLYGAADAQTLVDNNFAYTVEVPDMAVQARQDRAADTQVRRGLPGDRAAERPQQVPAPVRLQRGHEAARARAPGPGASDHAQPRDLRGPHGRGHRDRDEPERPRRPPGVPPDGRAPRA